MRCMCPNCGRKIDSSHLTFDFTEYIGNEIKKMVTDGETRADCEALFNDWQETPLLENEETLYSYPSDLNGNGGVKEKYVRYQLPYDRILKRAKSGSRNTKFIQWMEKNRERIEKKEMSLWLRKTGDGDIKVNQVLTKDGEPVAMVRRCPECYGVMSYWAGRYPEIALTVLGGPRTSKSTTLTACAYAFMTGNGDIRWEGAKDDKMWQFFQKNYLDYYRKGLPIKPTDDQDDKIPKISFKVTFKNRNTPICLTFVDIPGEFNGDQGVNQKVYQKYKNYYDNIDFIWYCTDPAEIRQLEGKAAEMEQLQSLGYERDQEIVKNPSLVSNMRNLSGFFACAERHVPVVYILGKTDSDIISEDEKQEFGLFKAGIDPVQDVLDVRRFYDQSKKVRSYIDKHNRQLLEEFENDFPDRCYIAVSAYGFYPKKNREERELCSFNCRMPFYWMLALRNCLDIRLVVEKRGFFGRIQWEEQVHALGVFPGNIREGILNNLYMHGSNYRI